jgi:hypothetical protein
MSCRRRRTPPEAVLSRASSACAWYRERRMLLAASFTAYRLKGGMLNLMPLRHHASLMLPRPTRPGDLTDASLASPL